MENSKLANKKNIVRDFVTNKQPLAIKQCDGYLTFNNNKLLYKSFNFTEIIDVPLYKLEVCLIRMNYEFVKCITNESVFYAKEKFEFITKELYSVGIFGIKRFANKVAKIKYNEYSKKLGIQKKIILNFDADIKFVNELKKLIISIDEIIEKESRDRQELLEKQRLEQLAEEKAKKELETKEKLRIQSIKEKYKSLVKTLDLDLLKNYAIIKQYEKEFEKELNSSD